jgi:hypothetical protein
MQTSWIGQQVVHIITSMLWSFKSPHSPEHKKTFIENVIFSVCYLTSCHTRTFSVSNTNILRQIAEIFYKYLSAKLLVSLYRNKTRNVSVTWHLGSFLLSLLQWKSSKYYLFWVCVCSLRNPAWNAHASICRLWPTWLYSIMLHFLLHGMIFETHPKNHWNMFRFSLQICLKHFSF